MDFVDFIGQKEVVNGLKNSIIQKRVGHAYIFSGPEGIGKRTLAHLFAHTLLCKKEQPERCRECSACKLLENNTNPDLHRISPINDSIHVEEIRKLQSDIMIKPLYGKKKIYIIENADHMTTQAQNCLLKILEEPPAYGVILLTTSNFGALLETIRSRAIKLNFKKNTYQEVRTFIEKKGEVPPESLDFIISYADGIIGTAIKLTQSGDFLELREKTTEIVRKISKNQLLDIFGLHAFFEANKQRIDMVFNIMLLLYRDYVMVKTLGQENVLINSDKRDIILQDVSNYRVEKLLENIEIIELTRRNIKQNANYQLSVEVMLMKLQEESFRGKGSGSQI